AVDRVEGECEAEQRRGKRDERLDRDVDLEDRDVDAELEQGKEQGRLAARLRGEGPELLAGEEERDPDREAQDDQQDDEPDREQVGGELLARDDRTAGARDHTGTGPGRGLGAGIGGRRRGVVGGRVRGGHATAPWAVAVRATARRSMSSRDGWTDTSHTNWERWSGGAPV